MIASFPVEVLSPTFYYQLERIEINYNRYGIRFEFEKRFQKKRGVIKLLSFSVKKIIS